MTQSTDHEGARQARDSPSNLQQQLRAFDPFSNIYLADPYPLFSAARTAAPVFYSADLGYWVVTRYGDSRRIFQSPKLFSAVNSLLERSLASFLITPS